MRLGALAALVAMFPTAFLLALAWKFPIPLGGYASGFRAALVTPVAVVVYGILGGFVVVPGIGALGGLIAYRLASPDGERARRASVVVGACCALAAGIFVNLLDRIIGPW